MTGCAPATAAHEAAPEDFSAYSMAGPNTGRPANLANAWHFPAEGICSCCDGVIRAVRYGEPWVQGWAACADREDLADTRCRPAFPRRSRSSVASTGTTCSSCT